MTPPSSFHVGEGLYLPLETYAPCHKKITGPSGFGKTYLAARLWKRTTFGGAPTILLDQVGQLYDYAEREVAATTARLLRELENNEDLTPSLRARIMRRFLSRFHFAHVSSGKPMPVTIDLLKRRRIDGELETVEHVVDGAMMPFEARFLDMDIRAQFISFARPMLACLIASGFDITYHDGLIHDPNFWPAVVERIEKSGLLEDLTQGNGPYVQHQMKALAAEFELRRRAPGLYEKHSNSTDNAFKSFEPGTVGGTFFSRDSFTPEDVVFGNHVFALTTDIDSAMERAQFIRSTEGIFQRLAKKRKPGTANRNLRLGVFWDEFSKSAYKGAFDWISESRNYRVTYTVMNQADDQFRSLGMPEMIDILPEIFPLRFEFRTTSRDIADRRALLLGQYDPFALQKVVTVHSNGTSATEAETETDSSTDTTSDGDGHNAAWMQGTQSSVDNEGNLHISTSESASDGGGRSGSRAWSFGSASSRSHQRGKTKQESEQVLTAGVSDQHTMRMQQIMALPRFKTLVTYDGEESTNAQIIKLEAYQPPEVGEREIRDLRRGLAECAEDRRKSEAPPPTYDSSISIPAGGAITPAPKSSVSPAAGPPATKAVNRPTASAPPSTSRTTTPSAFPPKLTAASGTEERAMATLQIVATIRLCTIQHVIALLSWNYDKAARELQRLVKKGAVEQIQPFAPRGEGSAPIIFVLNGTGARILAETGGNGEDLQRIAKNLGVFRRTIEANRPAQTEHRLWSSTLTALLIRSLSNTSDAAVTDVRFDRERSIPVDLTSYTIPDRERLLLGADPAKAVYVPDFSFVAHRMRDGRISRDVVLGEIETNFGERDARDLGAAKAWKMRALTAEFAKTRSIGTTTYDAGSELRIVVWNRTAALEERFFQGARSVFGEARSPLWITNGELLPLGIPSGTEKKHIEPAVATLIANIQQRVWRWLRFTNPTDRRRFVGTGGDK